MLLYYIKKRKRREREKKNSNSECRSGMDHAHISNSSKLKKADLKFKASLG